MARATGLLSRGATYQNLCEVPDHLIAEILGGDLWASPRPAPRHSHVAMMLTAQLVPPFQHGDGGPGGWRLLYEPELHLKGDVLVPDLAGWRAPRAHGLMDLAHVVEPPDWVCEILSASTENIDRALKPGIYAREGVRFMWLVDPVEHRLEVFKLADRTYVSILSRQDDEIATAEPFDAVPFPLTRLWPGR